MDGTPVLHEGEKSFRETVLTSDKLFAHKAYIEPLGEGEILVNGKGYRGSMQIVEEGRGRLTVINELPLEDYVMGVLAGEVPRNWPLEALKAQAVAARTFAVFQQREARKKGLPYDLENTAQSQVYQGSGLVNDNIRRAVMGSQGEVLTYKGNPIPAFFHSNCGGRTANALDVFSKDQPYLRSVPCPFDGNGSHYRWRSEVKIPELVRKLRAEGVGLADVVRLDILSRDGSGRVREVSLLDADGSHKNMKGTRFRMAVGPDVVRSTRFDSRIEGDKVVFTGRGWGHGVGLCQEGACGMAMKGYSAFDILRHYYQGITVERLKDI